MLIFTLITGIASVLSLLLPFVGNLQKWKTYFYYSGVLFLGITIGVLASMTEKSLNVMNTDQLITPLTILLIISLIAYVAVMLIKRNEGSWGYLVFALGLGVYLPMNIDKLDHKKNDITNSELLILIKNDEEKGDLPRAIELLTLYKKKIEDVNSKDSTINFIEKRIADLKRSELK